MLYTKEEILELRHRPNSKYPYYNYVITNKKGDILFYGNQQDIYDWVKKNCYKKIDWSSYPAWEHRILEWVEKSINLNQYYKGFKFHYYDKKWERKIKIEKLLNSENDININQMQRS